MRLKELLRDKLTDVELDRVVQGFDVVGDIAITEIPPELSQHIRMIGETILTSNKKIKVVATRDGICQGAFRTMPLSVIAGESRLETLHVEYGIKLLVNPSLVYFSVRSGSERKRIADLVTPGEDILVMFSGIAAYPLHLTRQDTSNSIVGVELNPQAHKYGLRNVELNRASSSIELILGDVRLQVPHMGKKFDRIIMPLPKSGAAYLDVALDALCPGGTIHYYDFQPVDCYDRSLHSIQQACRNTGRRVVSATSVRCGHTSPGIHRVCIDACIN